MSEKSNPKLIAFVGLAGSGKSSAVEYLSDKGVPKICTADTDEIVDEVTRLVESGQRTVAIDGIASIETMNTLKHAFPGSVVVVAIVSSRHHRLQREPNLDAAQLDERDWRAVESGTLGACIALADHFITNNADVLSFHHSIDALEIV